MFVLLFNSTLHDCKTLGWPVQVPMARFPWIVAQQHRTQLLQPWQRLLEEKRRLTAAVEMSWDAIAIVWLALLPLPAGPSSSAENASWRTSKCKPWSFRFSRGFPSNDWCLSNVCFLGTWRSKTKLCISRLHLKSGWTYLSRIDAWTIQ